MNVTKGLELFAGSSGGLSGVDLSWNTTNSSKSNLTTGTGVIIGGGWNFGWASDDNTGLIGNETDQSVVGDMTINIGLGKYLGVSFSPNLSLIQINIGFGLALPASVSLPLGLDAPNFGGDIFDFFHDDSDDNALCK